MADTVIAFQLNMVQRDAFQVNVMLPPDWRQVGKEKRIALDMRAKSPFKGFR